MSSEEASYYAKLFLQNLEALSEASEDFLKQWEYAGGDSGRHRRKFETKFGRDHPCPPDTNECVCTHPIVENCYIQNKLTGKMVVCGNCCIERFIGSTAMRCEECGEGHKNRLDNYCKECRGGIIDFGTTHKGKTFLNVFKSHPQYCQWAISKQQSTGLLGSYGTMDPFKKWLRGRTDKLI
jgi:hypothetical protein